MGHSIRLTWVRTGQQLLCTQRVPAMLRVVSVSLCKTLGLLAVATGCGHLSGLLGPPLCTSGPRLCFWFFRWGFAGPLVSLSLPLPPQLVQPRHISVIWVFWELRGLGMMLNLCFYGQSSCAQ